MSSEWDKNTRGIGVLLRFVAVVIPVVLFFVLFFAVERGSRAGGVPDAAISSVFRVIAFLWSWPYGVYSQYPFSFGAVGLAAVVMSALLLARHDRRGWTATLVFLFLFGWLVATIIGQAQGS